MKASLCYRFKTELHGEIADLVGTENPEVYLFPHTFLLFRNPETDLYASLANAGLLEILLERAVGLLYDEPESIETLKFPKYQVEQLNHLIRFGVDRKDIVLALCYLLDYQAGKK